jgi:hypothetical protein
MATLQRRLDRLEGKRGASFDKPDVIYLCGVSAVDRATGEATRERTAAAWVKVGASYEYKIRERGEIEEAFTARAEALSKV